MALNAFYVVCSAVFMIIYTIDYEVFGDGSGCFWRDLIRPTDWIIEEFRKRKLKAVFFLEVHELIALKRNNQFGYYNRVCKQIKNIVDDGHQLGLHVHPQFKDAKLIDGEWCLDMDAVALNKVDWNYDDYIHHVVEEFSELSKDCDLPTSRLPIAFRAGGYNVPTSKLFYKALADLGIKYESSQVVGYVEDNGYTNVDFSGIKRGFVRGPFQVLCAPIDSIQLSRFYRYLNWRLILSYVLNCVPRRNYPQRFSQNFLQSSKKKDANFFRSFFQRKEYPADFALVGLNILKRTVIKNGGSVSIFVGHPKSIRSRSYLKYVLSGLEKFGYRLYE